MGAEFEIDNAADLCAMMCDNVVPTKKKSIPKEKHEEWWIFTFGQGQKHAGHIVKVFGTYGSARQKMFDHYGTEWAFQYSLKEWGEWLRKKPAWIPEEQVLEVIK